VNDLRGLAVFVNVRLALVVALALGIATSVLGLINIFATLSLNAFPFYVYVVAGALTFPLSVFAFEYIGLEWMEAVQLGSGFSAVALLGFLLISEGVAKMANGLFDLGVATLFYVFAGSIVASTLLIVFAERLYFEAGRVRQTRSFGRK